MEIKVNKNNPGDISVRAVMDALLMGEMTELRNLGIAAKVYGELHKLYEEKFGPASPADENTVIVMAYFNALKDLAETAKAYYRATIGEKEKAE